MTNVYNFITIHLLRLYLIALEHLENHVDYKNDNNISFS